MNRHLWMDDEIKYLAEQFEKRKAEGMSLEGPVAQAVAEEMNTLFEGKFDPPLTGELALSSYYRLTRDKRPGGTRRTKAHNGSVGVHISDAGLDDAEFVVTYPGAASGRLVRGFVAKEDLNEFGTYLLEHGVKPSEVRVYQYLPKAKPRTIWDLGD